MLNTKYENLQSKPRMVSFFSVSLQLLLAYMFCSGSYTAFGTSLDIGNVFQILSDAKAASAQITFQNVATWVICLLYIGFAFRLIFNVLSSWRTSSAIKKLFREQEVDVLQAREKLSKLVLATRSSVYCSLAFLCYSRLASAYMLPFSMIQTLLVILLMCVLVEAKSFSYIQGKRGAFSFGKALCGYLLAVLAVVAVFNLKEKSIYDFAEGLIGLADQSLPKEALNLAYFLQVNVIAYLAPLCFVLGLFRPFGLLFRKTKNIFNTESLKHAANFYLICAILFLVTTGVLFGIHDQVADYQYYLKLVTDYAVILVFAVLAKLFAVAVNRRVRFPVKIMEMPLGERHTLD